LNITFWGVRGSIPTPGPETVFYGGNTSCVEVRTSDDRLFIFDAGTGIRNLGRALMPTAFGQGKGEAHLFISHTHWDHIQGFPFFAPFFVPGNRFYVHGLGSSEKNLKGLLSRQMKFCFFPVILERLAARIEFVPLKKAAEFTIDNITAATRLLNHPGGSLAYRFMADDKVCIYATDAEPYRESILRDTLAKTHSKGNIFNRRLEDHITLLEQELVGFFHGADVLIYDAQYTREEYPRFVGFGHSHAEYALELALAARVKHLVLFHHDPNHNDDMVKQIAHRAAQQLAELKASDLTVTAAREGETIRL
jgi:phosphoribosyl 1,2-cyclic phosphodiesterase